MPATRTRLTRSRERIDELERENIILIDALRQIVNKRKMDAVAAVSMKAIAERAVKWGVSRAR